MAKPRQECPGEWREVYDDGIEMGMQFKCPRCEAESPRECALRQDDPLIDDTRERVRDMKAAR